MSLPTWWLSTYARYRCRHAGACCTSGWPIPIERPRAALVGRAVQSGVIEVRGPWVAAAADQPAECAGLVAVDERRRCVFRQDERCAIHGAIGQAALPSACRHFPRGVLIDPRGVFVTLSHYCPTVAAMLVDNDEPPTIGEGPQALPDGELPEGLDAREAWPPLLRPGMLMEHAAYARWESHMVAVFGRATPAIALASLERDVERLVRWTPADGALAVAVTNLAERHRQLPRESSHGDALVAKALERFDRVRLAVPPPLTWDKAPDDVERVWREMIAPMWLSFGPIAGRYLAARAFGSWVAYQGSGLAAVVRSLDAALAVLCVEIARACARAWRPLDRGLFVEAVRRTDLLLVHYVDRQRFADLVSC